MNAPDLHWTLDELAAEVAVALSVGGLEQTSGRVRDVPDRRTIRYYTTLGLLDPPSAMRGRTALYGRRHLWQLLAIKRLQARGLSLTEIQARLLGLTDRALEKMAGVPSEEPAAGPADAAATQAPREDFWKAVPATGAAPANREEAAESGVRQLTALALAEGVTLLVDALHTPDEHDLAALRQAAEPLLKLLRARRLLGAEEGKTLTRGEGP